MPDVGRWTPISDAHAIQMAAVSVDFIDALPEIPWASARAEVTKAAAEIGLTTELIPSIQVAFGGPPNAQMAVPSIELRRMERPDFFSDRLIMARQSLRFEEWSYTRWNSLNEKLNFLFAAAFRRYGEILKISAISVDYADVFRGPAGAVRADCGEVIDVQSPYVARGAFHATQPWHTYIGRFEDVAIDVRRLHQVNIDVGDWALQDGVAQGIQIRTIVVDQMNIPQVAPFDQSKQTWTEMSVRLDDLHASAKEDLRLILTNEATRAISLLD